MVWNIIIVSKNSMQMSCLPTFFYFFLPLKKVEKTLDGRAKI